MIQIKSDKRESGFCGEPRREAAAETPAIPAVSVLRPRDVFVRVQIIIVWITVPAVIFHGALVPPMDHSAKFAHSRIDG